MAVLCNILDTKPAQSHCSDSMVRAGQVAIIKSWSVYWLNSLPKCSCRMDSEAARFSGRASWLHRAGDYIQLLDRAANLLQCPVRDIGLP